MRHLIQHSLSQDAVKQAAAAAVASYLERFPQYACRVDWTGDYTAHVRFAVRGVELGGEFEIEPTAIVLSLDVPLLFKPLVGRVLPVVEREAHRWLDGAARGALSSDPASPAQGPY